MMNKAKQAYRVYAHSLQSALPPMPVQTWESLTPREKQAWSAAVRAVITMWENDHICAGSDNYCGGY